MKDRRNVADKEIWAAEKTYCKKCIYIFLKMSSYNFRNEFWNPATFTSVVKKGTHFIWKTFLSIFEDIFI